MEGEIRTHLEVGPFHQKYMLAFQKWSEAEEKLWGSDSNEQQTIIGHLCREAFQEFVTTLVDKYNPPDIDTDKAHDINRLKSVLAIRSNQIGSTTVPFSMRLLTIGVR